MGDLFYYMSYEKSLVYPERKTQLPRDTVGSASRSMVRRMSFAAAQCLLWFRGKNAVLWRMNGKLPGRSRR